jgi:hypothetical protein
MVTVDGMWLSGRDLPSMCKVLGLAPALPKAYEWKKIQILKYSFLKKINEMA